jgi:hypothetical protein
MIENMLRDYGLLIERDFKYGTEYVIARLISRKPGEKHPLGVSDSSFSDERPAYLVEKALDGLGLYGFASDTGTDAPFVLDGAEYRDVHSIDRRLAMRMAKTLAVITTRRRKDNAYEPGDTFMSLAKALKLTFVVERKHNRPFGSNYSDNDWRFMTVEEGRNRYRALIEEARKTVKERKAA